jgi:hypothetical protein
MAMEANEMVLGFHIASAAQYAWTKLSICDKRLVGLTIGKLPKTSRSISRVAVAFLS